MSEPDYQQMIDALASKVRAVYGIDPVIAADLHDRVGTYRSSIDLTLPLPAHGPASRCPHCRLARMRRSKLLAAHSTARSTRMQGKKVGVEVTARARTPLALPTPRDQHDTASSPLQLDRVKLARVIRDHRDPIHGGAHCGVACALAIIEAYEDATT